MTMRIAFLGTPDFAVPSLQMLIEEGYEVAGVFAQPDRPKGRGGKLTPPPVKVLAGAHDIPVFQPEKIRLPEGHKMLKDLAPDLMITAAFGQILSKENLSVPPLGCINVHGSLLPKYRGAAPIQQAVIDGEKVTGVTTMLTDVGIDTGDMLLQKEIAILPDETAGELFDRIAVLGAQVLRETLEALKAGTLRPVPQDETLATHCAMLKKEDGHVAFTKSSQQIHDLIRGVSPWPGAYGLLDGEVLKFWRARIVSPEELNGRRGAPGEILTADGKNGLIVATADGAVEILELQAAGAKRMEAKAYLRGKSLPAGGIFA